MEQSDQSHCAECGTDVPSDAPLGLCPACLLKRAMRATTAGGRPSGGGWHGGFDPPPVEQLVPLFPQLEILEFIGRGGMGAVYKARQPHLDRFVAVKILPTTIADDPAFAERFAREARSLARLNHANVVTIHDFGRAGEFFFFVMEFVDGANLRQTLLAKALEPQQALAIVPQICDALQYAHDEGIVHRDIKPENVLLDKRGRVKIADFGLAKLLQKTPQNYTLTQTAVTMGTPHYMAPEQTERPLEVDHRADIYSLGVVFYEMLTGELPLGRFAAPSEKASIDARLDEVVFKTLEKEPGRRYQQASEVKTGVHDATAAAPPPRPHDAREPEPVLPYAQRHSSSYPQYSRMAYAGFIWGALGIVSLLLVISVGAALGASVVLMFPFLFFAITSQIGMPVCGLIAISQIHRSNGQITGLRLAAFDALAFPLLLVNTLMIGGTALLVAQGSSLSPAETFAAISAIGFPLCAVLDFFVVRYLWQRIRAGVPENAPALTAFHAGPSRHSKVNQPMPVIAYGEGARYSRTALVGAAWVIVGLIGPLLIAAGLLVTKSSTRVAVGVTPPARVGGGGVGGVPAQAPRVPRVMPAAPVAPVAPVATASGGGSAGRSGGGVRRPSTASSEDALERVSTAQSPAPSARSAGAATTFGNPTTMSQATAGTPRSGGGSGGGFASPRVTSIPRPPIAPAPLPAVTWASGITPMAMLVLFPLLAVAVTAPFGATILGIVAISQIRQSTGRLYGMPLAIFDTVVYPLLLLDVLIVGLIRTVLTHENASDVQIAVAGLIACAAAIVADVWIVRRVKDAAQTVPATATAG